MRCSAIGLVRGRDFINRLPAGFTRTLAGNGASSVLQAAYFILLARELGAAGYGIFVAVLAAGSILAPFAGLGADTLLVKRLAEEPARIRKEWGGAAVRVFLVGAVLSAGFFAAGVWIFSPEAGPLLVAAVAAATLIGLPLLRLCERAFQGLERFGRMSLLRIGFGIVRLAAVGILLLLPASSPTAWAVLYAGAVFGTVFIGFAAVAAIHGRPELGWAGATLDLREGSPYAASQSARFVHNDLDKAMLASMSGAGAAGVYAAGYRLVEMSLQPLSAFNQVTLPGFFRAGSTGPAGALTSAGRTASARSTGPGGVAGTLELARRYGRFAVPYALAAGVLLYGAAGLAPAILGADFQSAVPVIRWLAVLPLLRAVQMLAGDALTGGGRQGPRTALLGAAVAINVVGNLLLIPAFSWRGAVAASLISEGVLALGSLIAAVGFAAAEREKTAERTAGTPTSERASDAARAAPERATTVVRGAFRPEARG